MRQLNINKNIKTIQLNKNKNNKVEYTWEHKPLQYNTIKYKQVSSEKCNNFNMSYQLHLGVGY